ncbi:AlpA family phage regulatory protein [Aquincola sp. S2]|uniref:AlpA family phage regulatory protein n=1 Tax=Pseudaquabacterium terrae TaxID=2732868 RepID=A0ABX2EP05_9BURK|nr:AlpA family phage regulatory protein [Aquabacterium terrae]NRF70353.1 AlpA family phage regulatory protein [Aquabacterium terrae]
MPQPLYYRESQLIGRRATPTRSARTGLLPFSSATLWRMVRAGKFPKPVKLADRVTAWPASDVDAWRQSRTAA